MTLKHWGVENFKSIGKCDFPLADINVVLGANSIGKSSLIQSMVTLNEFSESALMPGRIDFSGSDLDLGNNTSFAGNPKMPIKFNWVVKKKSRSEIFDPSEEIKMSLSFHPPNKDDTVLLDNFVSSTKSKTKDLTYSLSHKVGQGSLVSVSSEHLTSPLTLLKDPRGFRRKDTPLSPAVQVTDWFLALWLIAHETSEEAPSLILGPGGELTKGAHKGFAQIWSRFIEMLINNGQQSTAVSEESKVLVDRFLQALTQPRHMGSEFPNQGTLELLKDLNKEAKEKFQGSKYLDEILTVLAMRSQEASLVEIGFRQSLLDEMWQISDYLDITGLGSRIFYLGPIRAITPRQQENRKSQGVSTTLGVSGENMAFLLAKRGSRPPAIGGYILPEGIREDITLIQATEKWMEYLGVGVKLKISDSRGLGPLVEVNGRTLNQVGSGISQMLPVVVLCLLAGNEAEVRGRSLLLLEQPELHLHPSSQALLGDLVVTFANHGVQFMIETHSEYLVTRLRLLAIRKKTQAQIGLVFAEPEGKSSVALASVKLDSKGRAEYWPKGFMEQVVSDRVALSGLQFLDEE